MLYSKSIYISPTHKTDKTQPRQLSKNRYRTCYRTCSFDEKFRDQKRARNGFIYIMYQTLVVAVLNLDVCLSFVPGSQQRLALLPPFIYKIINSISSNIRNFMLMHRIVVKEIWWWWCNICSYICLFVKNLCISVIATIPR